MTPPAITMPASRQLIFLPFAPPAKADGEAGEIGAPVPLDPGAEPADPDPTGTGTPVPLGTTTTGALAVGNGAALVL